MQFENLRLTEEQVESYALFEIESILLKMGKTLRDVDGMPIPDSTLIRDLSNGLVNEELDYDRIQLKKLHAELYDALNTCQKSAYKAIMHLVDNEIEKLFFINGQDGTSKTYL